MAQVNNLKEPEPEEINTIRSWLERQGYGDDEITSLESKAWAAPGVEGAVEELVSLQSSFQQMAPFSSWATGKLLTLIHDTLGRKLKVSCHEDFPNFGAPYILR